MNRTTDTLIVTSQALSVTSQLLAIGIEIGIIAGGFYIYRKVTKELNKPEPEVVAVPMQMEKPSFKNAWEKTKRIYKAVFS